MASLNKTLIPIILILALIPGGNATSQDRPSLGENPERGEARERIRENIETIRTWKLLEALDLTSEQSAQFLPVLRTHRFDRRNRRPRLDADHVQGLLDDDGKRPQTKGDS